ncbi:hypothetical protein KFK09_007276 [Dendrobium nobile]|uniref:Uncharacterized protein n=1 Tax=Dendrobium nobile TaxID=94219 RepID=A0A8T3BRG5_DENNO|nr:hypothetical protein KFK09_007276 [Dendrobium nobile]
MGNSLRCCLTCILPCGTLDVVRIVHLSGHVEEYYSRQVIASDVLAANPGHILSKPSSDCVDVRQNIIMSPESKLKRGSIDFLIPLPEKKKKKMKKKKKKKMISRRRNEDYDAYLTEILSEKKVGGRRHHGGGGRGAVWRPNLECISED